VQNEENNRNQQRVERESLPTGEAIGDDPSYLESRNPLSQLSRFSKALSPYYLAISVGFSFLGSLWGVYSQIISTINKREQIIIDKIDAKYQIPFYKLDEHDRSIQDHEKRLRDIENYSSAPRRRK
jgi:hypothetical protein